MQFNGPILNKSKYKEQNQDKRALSRSPETTAFQCWKLSIVNIFWYLIRADQIYMSKLYKRLHNNASKFGDHLSIISVGNDVQRFFYFWL
jgi:hypothetical protein